MKTKFRIKLTPPREPPKPKIIVQPDKKFIFDIRELNSKTHWRFPTYKTLHYKEILVLDENEDIIYSVKLYPDELIDPTNIYIYYIDSDKYKKLKGIE